MQGIRIVRENVLLRVVFTTLEKAGDLPAYEAFERMAEEAGCRGATVLRGEEGLTPGGRRIAPRAFSLAEERPLVVEVVDTPGRVGALLRRATAILRGRFVSRERAAVVVHRGRGGGPAAAADPPGGEEGAMPTEEAGVLVRVFLSEEDRHGNRSLAREILDRAAAAGIALALALKSPAGYGPGRGERTTKEEVASMGQPVVVEIADAEAKVRAFLPRIEEILRTGLVTVEKVALLRYP